MSKYTVTLAVTVPAYAEIEIEAESQAAAEQAVAKELDELDKACVEVWDSPLWHDPTFEPAWQEAEDFRLLDERGWTLDTDSLIKGETNKKGN